MKKIIYFTLLSAWATLANAQLYSSTQSNVSFFSKTPVEDINATSTDIRAIVNVKTNEVAFLIGNTTFQFPNKLMQEHFNEKYMESEKYPMSTFKGKIAEQVDLTKEGTYQVTVSGKLNIHGVEKDRTITGTITVSNGTIHIKSDFKVLVKDHNITIPKLVLAKIAEEISVMVDATLAPKK